MAEIEQLSVNVLRVQKSVLKQLAEMEGETMSVVIRRLIKKEAIAKGVWPDKSEDAKGNVF